MARELAIVIFVWQRLIAGGGVGRLYTENRGRPRAALRGGCWPGEAGGGFTRSTASCVIGWVYIWLSLVVPKLEIRDAVNN